VVAVIGKLVIGKFVVGKLLAGGLGGILLAAAAVVLARMMPDIRRYVQMKRM
jgi:hypothetical protein